jgi:PAS domain S-box-containing protein
MKKDPKSNTTPDRNEPVNQGEVGGSSNDMITGAHPEDIEPTFVMTPQLMNAVFISMNEGISVLDPGGVHIDVNPALCKMTGFSRGELVGTAPPHPYWDPEAYDEIQDAFRRTLDGEKGPFELRFLKKDKTHLTVLVSPSQVHDIHGKVIGFTATVKDITNLKRAEAELAAVQEQYRELFENVSIGILRSTPGPEGAFIEANPATLRIFEADSREQFFAVRPVDLYYDPEERRKISDELMAKGIIRGKEVRYKTLKGNLIWGHISATRKTSQDGKTYFDNTLENFTERKQAEEALKESEDRFRKIFENSPLGMVLVTPDFRFLSVNPAWTAMTGYTEEELLKMSFKDITHPDHITGDLQHMHELVAGTVPVYNTQKRYIRKDGSILWGLLRVTTVRDNKGLLRYFAAQVEDITERLGDQEKLTCAKEYAETLISNANAMIIGLDTNGMITTFNPAAELTTGYTAAELAGRNWFEVIVPKDRYPQVWEEFTKLKAGGLQEHFENPILTKYGVERYIVWRNREIRSKGEITGTISFGIDITERKQAEDAQRDLSTYNRGLIEASIDPMVTISHDGKVQDVNSATEMVTGLSRHELIGTDFSLYFTEPEKAREGYRQVFSEGKVIDYPLEIRHPDGHSTPVLYNATVYRDSKGNIRGAFAVARDVTERKHSEREREHLVHELESKNTELDRFNYTVSHDLKSPLITIRGFLGYLEKDFQTNDTEHTRADIMRIAEAVGKMERLISTLLELSRSGKSVDTPDQIPFTGLALEAAGLLDVSLKTRGISLTIDENLPVVSGDRERLLQVMTNLIENAVKFMGDQKEPVVQVGVRIETAGQAFFVRDNGLGIRKEDQPKIFGLFERLNPNIPGTGIGLATVKRIIEAHGGKIWVESEGAGKGTTFWFTLPGMTKTGTTEMV